MPPLRSLLPLLFLAGCGGDYSADTYATRAVQQVDPVQKGVIVGQRDVDISADGAAGAAVGGAAGGIVGAATPGSNLTSALAGVGGGLVGGLFGTATERVIRDNRGTEYIVQQMDGKLVRVTQRDVPPLPVGTQVLVIAGAQARIVRDYTQPVAPAATAAGSTQPGPAVPPATAAQPPGGAPPSGTPAPAAEAPVRTELPPAAPTAGEAPPSPRAPLAPPEVPLSL